MKKTYLLIALLLFNLVIIAQTTGDFRSKHSGMWDNFSTWERYDGSNWQNAVVGEIPTNTSNVQILATHVVTQNSATAECNNIIIDATAELVTGAGTANVISIYGNFTNNGTLNFFDGAKYTAIIFAGTGDAVFSGAGATTDISTIEVAKSVITETVTLSPDNFTVQELSANAPQFLIPNTGTFKLSGTFNMTSETFVGGASYNFDNTKGFWLDNPNFEIIGQAGSFEYNGLIRISNGVFNVGTSPNNRFYPNNSDAQFIMEGGTLNIEGSFYSGGGDAITYNQSGGTINVARQQVTTGYQYCFRIAEATASFTMSGGIINLVQTNTNDREYSVACSDATTNITGGTLNVGTAATASDFNFELEGRMPNTIVHSNTTAYPRNSMYIYDDLTVNGIFSYRNADNNVHVYGDLLINSAGKFQVTKSATSNRTQRLYIYGSIISDGTLLGYWNNGGNEGRLYAEFMGATDETITGAGATCLFYDIRINKGSDMTSTLEVIRNITLDPGDSNDGNRLYVENGTFKLSSNSNLTPYYNNQTITSTTGRFWLNHADAIISWSNVGNSYSRGEFILDAGTFNSGNYFIIEETSTANNQVNGGKINVPGSFDMEQDLLITDGTIDVGVDFIVDANGAGELGDLTQTGGDITIAQKLYISGKLQISAGTITSGDGNDRMQIYEGGTLQVDGGNVIINGYTEIRDDATANTQINGGTLKVTGNFDMEQDVLITGGTVTCDTNFYMDGDGDNESGDLTITNGILNVGDGNDLFQARGNGSDNGQGGSFTMSNGTVNIFGRVYFDNGTGTEVCSFNMTGGNFNIDPQHTSNLANNVDIMYFNDNSIVNFTGGTLTFIDPHADKNKIYRDAIDIRGQTGAKNFIGSTICFGDGVSNSQGDDLYPGYSIYVANNFDLQFGDIILNNPTGINREFYGRNNTNILCNNLTITTANDKYIMNGKNLEIKGDFINNGELDGTVRNTNNHLFFNGTTAQSYSGTGFLTSNLNQLTVNNTSATGLSLSADIGADIINLTDGHVYSNASPNGLLTVYGTNPTDLVGGTSANYVQGPLRRAIPNNASSTDYDFPVGKANFRLFELLGLKTSGTGDGFITSEFFPTTAEPATGGNGMTDPLESNDVHWKINNDLSSVNIDHVASVRVTYSIGAPPPVLTLAQSNTGLNGTYDAIGRLVTATTLQSEEYKSDAYDTNAETYLCIGAVEPLEGTYTVGNSGDYLNLTEVAAELRIKYVNDWVVFEMLADYDDATETFPVDFDVLLLTLPKYNVTIRPQAGAVGTETALDGFGNGAEIYINHIHDLRFDGRPGGVGAGDWLFEHRDATPTPVFTLKNNAYADTLSYLTIKSDIQSNTNGVIRFEADGGDGNDNIVIDNCNITGSTTTPTIAIYSEGNAGSENDNNKIDNCNIYDFFNATENPYGIYLGANNSDWIIENNRFYQTAPRIFTEEQTYYAISINSGENHIINNNTIGFEDKTGNNYTDISGSTSQFRGIYMSVDNGVYSNITNNTISGIKFSSLNTGNYFVPIQVSNGDVNVGTVGNGNTIGSVGNFVDYPIQLTYNANDGNFIGIYSQAGSPTKIIDNKIGGVKTIGNFRTDVFGIYTNNANNNSDYVISGNIIGSTTQPNSFSLGTLGDSQHNRFYGIFNYRADNVTISNNTIQNITSYSESTSGDNRICGIYHDYDIALIENNTIGNLTHYSGNQNDYYAASIVGIVKRSNIEGQTIRGNEIFGLTNLNPNNRYTRLIGLDLRGSKTTKDIIDGNFIHNFESTSNNAEHKGVRIDYGTYDFINNMIQLGIDKGGNSVTNPINIIGIQYRNDEPVDFYHNSIYIGGTGVTSQTDRNSYCINKKETELSIMKNNIFVNERSNSAGTDSKHYALYLSYEDVVNADYNIYYITGTGGTLANLDGFDFTTLRAMKAYADNGNDNHSGSGSPNFISPTGDNETCDLHLQATTPAEGMGVALGITTDIDNQDRSTLSPVDIGADAGNFTFDASVDIYSPNFEYLPIEPQSCGITTVNIDVRITDQGVGVPLTGANIPRLYYRDNSLAWTTATDVAGTLQSGDKNDGVWHFTFTPLQNSKFYEYYFVAEDQANNPASAIANGAPTTNNVNIGYSKFDALSPIHTDVNNPNTYPDGDVEIDVFTVCVYPAATYMVGNFTDCPTCDFETLTAYGDFFFNMNAMIIDKDVTCYIAADTDEPADFPANQTVEEPVNSNYQIHIQPYDASLKVLNSNNTINDKMIRFEGADRYTISGEFNSDGNQWLEFSHDKDDQSVFYFKDDAQDITLEHLVIKGSGALNPRGTIFFDSTTVANPQGNKNIIIDNNKILAHTKVPLNAIYSYGGQANNSNISITNNEIDAFQSIAIWATDHFNDNWTISNNIIYNTFVNDKLQAAISIESGSNYTISGNQIGGSDATLGGAAMTNTYLDEFNAIYMNVDDAIISNITNNTIKNIASNRIGWGNELRGIRVEGGKVNITGNNLENFRNSRNNRTYGISYLATSGVSISNNTITDFTTTGNGDLRAFYINTDEVDVNTFDNNVIKNMTVDNTGGNVDFYGLYHENGRTIISNNTIGGNNPTDKITHNGNDSFTGFYMRDASGNDFDQTISNNQILNIEITNNNRFRGFDIRNTADGVPINITNNTIDNLNLNCSAEVTPFFLNDGQVNVNNNNVGTAGFGISNSGDGIMRGFYFATNDNNAILDNNTITNLDNNGTIYGIDHNQYRSQTISNNTIHGINTANDISFTGIRITNGNNLSVQGNTVQDIVMTNGGANTNFTGIEITSGTVNLGTIDGNLVGNNTTANSISINGTFARGFNIANDVRTTTAQDNTVANMTTTGANTQFQAFAITNTGGTADISGNTAKNINANGTGNTSVSGFYIDEAGAKNITQNTVRDISTTSTKTDISNGILASQGFHIAGTSSANISENEIYNISATGNANINVAGISENATNAQITKNKIYNISNATSGSGTVSGIVLYNLNAGYVANNMISIGNNDAVEYSGIWLPQANTNTKNVYFNSIYIGGTATGGNSYAFLRGNNTTPLYVRNNILSNFRTGGAGKHFAMGTQNTTWNASYMQANGYYSATSATIGNWAGADNNFETLLTNVGESGTYLSTDQMPEFVDATNCDLHINPANSCGFNSVGEAIATITDDYDGDLRSTNPDIGADEFIPTGRSGRYVWRGHTDNYWDTDENWQCELTPTDNPGELIIIPEVTNEPIIARSLPAATVLVDAMDIRSNGNLIVNPGNSITLSGNLTLNGTITIETPANEFDATGSFIDNGTITGTGQMIAKRFVNGGQYHEISSPIKQGTGNNTSAIFTRSNPSGNYNPNLYLYDETVDLDGNVNTEPAGAFDNNNLGIGWYYGHNGEAGADINLIENQGYMFYTDQYQILQFEGEPATGNFDVSGLSFTNNDPDNDASGANPTQYNLYDGWHLLGNPFPSSIDWDKIRDDQISGIDDGIYVWDNTGYSGYKNGSSVQNGNLTNLIPPMQGFFVRTNGGATPPAIGGQNFVGSVEIRNEHRTHNAPTYLKSKFVHTNYLKLKTSANGHEDFIVVQFLPDATNEYDGEFDLVRMFVNPSYGDATLPQLYSITENENDPLSLNVLPENEMIGKIVPLGLSIGNAGNYTISVDEFNDFDNIHVYLNDNLTNSKINLRNTNTYSFYFAGGKVDDRFYLNFEANHAPVFTNEISNQETLEDAEFTFAFAENTFIDEDFGDVLRYEIENLPTWLSFNSETRTFTGTPSNENVGVIELEIISFDIFNESDTAFFTLTVINTNDAPILANQIPDMQTNANEIYSFQIPENIFNDIDLGDNLTLKANLEGGYLLPSWLNFNPNTKTLFGTPTNSEVIDIEVTATDMAGESVSDIFELTVLETSNISENTDFEIEIYPNPASDFIVINFAKCPNFAKVELQITDISGKLILEKNITSYETIVDIKQLAVGTYFVEIENGTEIFTEKIVKK